MNTKRLSSLLILPVLWCAVLFTPSVAIGGSQDAGPTYTPLAIGPILGVEQGDSVSPVEVMKDVYNISIGLGSILAVIMIVWGGMKYTVSEAVGSKQDAIDTIQGAVWGLVLLIGSYLILRTINADLVNINLSLSGGGRISNSVVETAPVDSVVQEGRDRVAALQNQINSINQQLAAMPNQATPEARALVEQAEQLRQEMLTIQAEVDRSTPGTYCLIQRMTATPPVEVGRFCGLTQQECASALSTTREDLSAQCRLVQS